MPSREEIVEWLKEAAVLAKQVSRYQHAIGAVRSSDETASIIRKFEKRAAQVSAMRCETCKHYDKQHQLCEVVGGSELLIPGYFGCFYQRTKETRRLRRVGPIAR